MRGLDEKEREFLHGRGDKIRLSVTLLQFFDLLGGYDVAIFCFDFRVEANPFAKCREGHTVFLRECSPGLDTEIRGDCRKLLTIT